MKRTEKNRGGDHRCHLVHQDLARGIERKQDQEQGTQKGSPIRQLPQQELIEQNS
jgi:hypothetical protein